MTDDDYDWEVGPPDDYEDEVRLCKWPDPSDPKHTCALPMRVASTFVLEGAGPDGRFTSLFVRLVGDVCGHFYQEEVGELPHISLQDQLRLDALDRVKAARTPGKWGEGTMPCIMCGTPVPQRKAYETEEGSGKYCERCK